LTKFIGEYGGHIPTIEETTIATSVYFFSCALVILLCLISFVYIFNTEFVTTRITEVFKHLMLIIFRLKKIKVEILKNFHIFQTSRSFTKLQKKFGL